MFCNETLSWFHQLCTLWHIMNICNKMCAVQNSQLCIESLTMCVLHMHRKLDTSDALRAPNTKSGSSSQVPSTKYQAPNTKSGSSTNPQVSASPHHATWKQPLRHATHSMPFITELLRSEAQLTLQMIPVDATPVELIHPEAWRQMLPPPTHPTHAT